MYDIAQKRMYSWDDPIDRHAICVCLEKSENNPNLLLMPYSQFKDTQGKEIYCADICDIEILNEFGSITQKRAVMMSLEVNPWGYAFVLETPTALTGDVVSCKLLGNMCQNPDMVKLNNNDYQSRPQN